MVGLGARLEKVSPDIDFYAGHGGEQGQPEKDLIYTRLFFTLMDHLRYVLTGTTLTANTI